MKIFKYILMAALTLPVVSCVHEEEDLSTSRQHSELTLLLRTTQNFWRVVRVDG